MALLFGKKKEQEDSSTHPIKSAVGGQSNMASPDDIAALLAQQSQQQSYPEQPISQQQQDYQAYQQAMYQQPQSYSQPISQENYSDDSIIRDIQEVAEAIVAERWEVISKEFDKIRASQEDVVRKVDELTTTLSNFESRVNNLEAGVFEKIRTFNDTVEKIGAEIKAMEQIFSKIIPSFSATVARLSEVADKMHAPQTAKEEES